MRIEATACIHCDLCGVLLPECLTDPERIPVSPAALEAMATCPTGAIVWFEEEPLDEGRGS
jgi:ferredoxin